MRKRSTAFLVLLVLAACDRHDADPRIALCLSATQQVAVSPSSVKVVHFNAAPQDAKQAATKESSVRMDFDAANSFGTALRDTAECEFAPHPSFGHHGRFLLTKAKVGQITLNEQQIADANSLDGSTKGTVDAMIAAEALKREKASAEQK